MNNNTIVQKIMQEIISEKAVIELSEKHEYEEVGRKLKAYSLLQYFMGSSMLKIKSYRELAETSATLGLVQVDYSELSKKAKEVPYEIYLELCRETFAKFNREKRRKLTKSITR